MAGPAASRGRVGDGHPDGGQARSQCGGGLPRSSESVVRSHTRQYTVARYHRCVSDDGSSCRKPRLSVTSRSPVRSRHQDRGTTAGNTCLTSSSRPAGTERPGGGRGCAPPNLPERRLLCGSKCLRLTLGPARNSVLRLMASVDRRRGRRASRTRSGHAKRCPRCSRAVRLGRAGRSGYGGVVLPEWSSVLDASSGRLGGRDS